MRWTIGLAVGVVTIANFITDRYNDARHDRDTAAGALDLQFQEALLDAGYGVRSYLLAGQVAALLPYQLVRQRLTGLAPTLLRNSTAIVLARRLLPPRTSMCC